MSDELPVVGCARYSALISLLQTHPSSLSIFILGLGPCHFFTPLPAAHLWGQSARGPEWSWNAVRGRKFSRLSVLASCSCQNALSDGLSPGSGPWFQVPGFCPLSHSQPHCALPPTQYLLRHLFSQMWALALWCPCSAPELSGPEEQGQQVGSIFFTDVSPVLWSFS